MTLRPVATVFSTMLFALGCLAAAGGAHAQAAEQVPAHANAQATARATAQTSDSTRPNIATASIRTPDTAVQPAAAPDEALVQSDRPTQLSERDREIARARRVERREIISEGLGISVEELNDLLRRVRPPAEERRQTN